jgi:gliding motility-associated-like protein
VQDATICEGKSTVLTASNSTGGTVSYNFYDAQTGGTLLGVSPLTVSPTDNTVYYLEAINQYGCVNSAGRIPATVTVVKAPQVLTVTAANTSVCYGDSTTLTATASQGSTITWWDNAVGGNQLGTGTTLNTGKLTQATTYYAQASTTGGCTSLTVRKPLAVDVVTLPEVTLTSDKDKNTIFPQEVLTFTASPAGYANYDFYVNGNKVQSGSSNTYASSKFSDKDSVIAIANDNGCGSIPDTAVVKIVDFPNVFSPNADGKNDKFLKDYDLVILNRWGQELYKGLDGWDGTYKGNKVAPGTYFYIVQMENITDRKTPVKGTVLLIQD